MKRRVWWVLIVALIGSALLAPLAAAAPPAAGPVLVKLGFNFIRQGRAGLVYVEGGEIAAVRAVFQGRAYNFYPDGARFTGLISADMDGDVGQFPLQVWVDHADGTSERIDQPIQVNYGEFGRSEVYVSAALQPLLEPQVELDEMAQLFNILSRFTPTRYWAEQGFIRPSPADEVGWFGANRLYNGTYWRRHTGLDMRVPPNTPVTVVASGRVMLAETLDIRGNYVLIDHGWGVYSGYAHLTQILAVPGQWVRQGDVIGLSGSTGRSGGAHLHWEMAVGGVWVDPGDFVALRLGGAGPQ